MSEHLEEVDVNKQIPVEDQKLDGRTLEVIDDSSIIRPKLQRVFPKTWILCLVLYLIFFIIRGVGCLGPESLRILILIGFGLMWPLPFIFYTKYGWKTIGLKKIEKPWWLLWGFLLGVGAAVFVYFIGWSVFRNTDDH